MQHIAAKIEALRVAQGLSETQLADASAIARSTLTRRMVAPETIKMGELERLAVALNTSVFTLVGIADVA